MCLVQRSGLTLRSVFVGHSALFFAHSHSKLGGKLKTEPGSAANSSAIRPLNHLIRVFCFTFFSGLARDCQDLFVQGQRASGIYTVQPGGSGPFNVLCEMTTGERVPESGLWIRKKKKTILESLCSASSNGDSTSAPSSPRRWMDRHPETSRWIPELQPAVGKLQERLRQPER